MERFVVGTGRCGSTLLSNMLSCHPKGLILSECLGAIDRLDHLKPGLVSKNTVKTMLCDSNPFVDMSIRRGGADSEALFDEKNRVDISPPVLLIATLPFLTDKPAELLAEIIEQVDSYPDQTMAEHYSQLFSWLQMRLNRDFWIERSGESTVYLPRLFATFPRAKYIHIHRHGPEVVMSMAKHSYLSLVTSFFSNPASREELAQTEYGGKPVSPSDPISLRFTNRPGYEEYAAYWNYQLSIAYQTFAKMDPSQLLQVRFDELIADPKKILEEISDFFELPGVPGWMDKAAGMVDSTLIRSSLDKLTESEREQLDKACMPGQVLLERYHHPWVYPLLEMVKELKAERL